MTKETPFYSSLTESKQYESFLFKQRFFFSEKISEQRSPAGVPPVMIERIRALSERVRERESNLRE